MNQHRLVQVLKWGAGSMLSSSWVLVVCYCCWVVVHRGGDIVYPCAFQVDMSKLSANKTIEVSLGLTKRGTDH